MPSPAAVRGLATALALGLALGLGLAGCAQQVTVTRAGDHPSEVQAQELLEIALTQGCAAAVEHYIDGYHEDPEQRARYAQSHLELCESPQVQQALAPRAWHCAADLFELERVRVQCRPDPDNGTVVPFAYRTPEHFRGESTSISWGTIQLGVAKN
ncbi:hypothetical protein [Granulicoccus sp. GXG6511]|uniref:hypothetical protein n=1 Tax=Granulicoccus sp. GXG6511 TaxID=3381351 RepID=UPI003D7C751D